MTLTPEDLAKIQEKMAADQADLDQLREDRETTDAELDTLKQRAASQKAREAELVKAVADAAKQLSAHYGGYAPARRQYVRKAKPAQTEE